MIDGSAGSASSSASAVATASFVASRRSRLATERLGRRRLDEAVRGLGALDRRGDQSVAEDDRSADRLEPEGAVRVAPQRVVDLGDHARHVEPMLGELRGQGIAVIALGQGHDDVGLLGAGRAHDVLVGAVAADGLAAERRRQAAEGARGHVDDHDVSPRWSSSAATRAPTRPHPTMITLMACVPAPSSRRAGTRPARSSCA